MTQTPLSQGLIGRITQAARFVVSGAAPDAWFGPLQPLKPAAPPEVAGRRFDYASGYNLVYTPRSEEPVSFDELRALADGCDILRSVIETRKDQLEAQSWTVRVKAKEGSPRVPIATDDQKRRIDAIFSFLQSPDGQNGFDQWLRQILEDMFVIDAVAIYKRRNRAGGLFALEVMDAATIKLLLDDSGRAPLPPDPAYQQVLKGVPAADYTREELLYLVHNPRSHKVYGYSHVEQVLVTVNILIRRALHQLEYYREGSLPDALVGTPKEWTSDQIADFQKHFDAMLAGNLGSRRRMRFMPGDFKYQETKAPPLKDSYDEFLARIVCFVFSISPEPFVGQVNRATAQTSHARALDEGLAPLMRFVSSLLNRIIACEFGSPDLEFAWEETRATDPESAARIDVAYVGAGILTPDEVRANLGLAPMNVPGGGVKKKFHRRRAESYAALSKDIFNDEEEDPEEENPDESDTPDGGEGGDDFNAKHPRWPAGAADGMGGQFAPKDSDAATGSGDATGSNSLDPQRAANALTSAIDRPSNLPDGTEVAGDDTAPHTTGIDGYDPNDPNHFPPFLFLPIPEMAAEQVGSEAATASALSGDATAASTENAIPVISDKIESQMADRVWTQESILETIESPYTTRASINQLTGNRATVYYNEDGSHVIVDDVTNKVVQISRRYDSEWIPDKNIQNPYKP